MGERRPAAGGGCCLRRTRDACLRIAPRARTMRRRRICCMLTLSRPGAEVFIPDGTSWEAACARVTHLVVAAHADDVELMAWHAVLNARGLAAVIVTDGRGSAR